LTLTIRICVWIMTNLNVSLRSRLGLGLGSQFETPNAVVVTSILSIDDSFLKLAERSTRRQTNLPNGQLAESEVISPESRVTHWSSDLLTTACDRFPTNYVNSTCLTHAIWKPTKVASCDV